MLWHGKFSRRSTNDLAMETFVKDSDDQLNEDLALPFKGLRAGWRNPQRARLRSELEHLQAMLNERKHAMSSRLRPETVKEHEQATTEQHENRPDPYDPAINLKSAKEYLEH